MKELFNIQGKTAIVTGGSRGIGGMIAEGFVKSGVKTYITSRTASECTEKAKQLSDYGECIALPCDLSSLEGIQAFACEFKAREKKLDILVNNAGMIARDKLTEATEQAWDPVMDLNLKTPFFLVQQFLDSLKSAATEDNPARIITIASIAGMKAPQVDSAYSYSVSKAAAIHLTRHLVKRLSRENITINSISPGVFATRQTEESLEKYEEHYIKATPRRRLGDTNDIAGAAIYLASPAGAWLTGINIPVDGGMSVN